MFGLIPEEVNFWVKKKPNGARADLGQWEHRPSSEACS